MFFFFHIFAGIVLALLLADYLDDKRVILPCVTGAFLPDLIDKPLGYLFFADLLGNGRILLHNFFLVLVLPVTGYFVWKRYARPELFALSLGIIAHQFLDLMWEDPGSWLFPFAGPLTYEGGSEVAFDLLQSDASLRSEWVIAIAVLLTILLLPLLKNTGSIVFRHRALLDIILLAGTCFFIILACGSFIAGIWETPLTAEAVYLVFGWIEPAQGLAGGIVFLMAVCLFWRTRRRLGTNGSRQPGFRQRDAL